MAKQPISWPLTGGLQTKASPFMLAPGSHTDIVNLRQERHNEWKPRYGSVATASVPGGTPMRATALPGGAGAVALMHETGFGSASRVYSPTASPQWGPASVWQQSTPVSWSRKTTAALPSATQKTSLAQKPGAYGVCAWTDDIVGAGVAVQIVSSNLTPAGGQVNFGNTGAKRPACVYNATEDKLTVYYFDPVAASIMAVTYNASTGAFVSGPTAINGASPPHATDCWLDALSYGGSTNTVVFRLVGDNIRFIEHNPTSGATPTAVTNATSCADCLALLPDPDASGIRFVAGSNASPATYVIRINSAGVQQSFNNLENVESVNVAGVAYQSGASFMIAYTTAPGGGAYSSVHVAKLRSGVTANAVVLGDGYFVESGAWRESGTDLMRYIVGYHVTDDTTHKVLPSVGGGFDSQHSYYEKANNYDTGASISDGFTEAQARILPLNAVDYGTLGTGGASRQSALQQVQRMGTDVFQLPLIRRSRAGTATSFASASQYTIDTYTATYLNASNYNLQNLGEGMNTSQAAYQPAGALLASVNGEVYTQGGAGLPRRASLTQSTFGGAALTLTSTYSYTTTMEYPDASGNVWISSPSTVASFLLTGGNNQFTVASGFPSLDNANRIRTVKLWRTKANGSIYYLVAQKTGTVAATASWSFVDNQPDSFLDGADILNFSEAPTTITPPAAHVQAVNGRLYLVDRDFPTRVWLAKPFRTGRQPEFVADQVVIIEDEQGDITGLDWLDDKAIVCKETASYALIGQGPDLTGAGALPQVVRISTEKGAHVGTPTLSLGDEVWMFGSGQLQKIDRSLTVTFVGEPLDMWFNQPQVTTPESVLGMVVNAAANEVRVQTTNYRFVYDSIHGVWMRDTGVACALTLMVAGQQMLLRSSGVTWLEGDRTNITDAGTVYQAFITSAWVRPADIFGWLRLYSVRFLGLLTAGGADLSDPPSLTIYYDDDVFTGANQEAGQPQVTIPFATNPLRVEYRTKYARKCSSFQIKLTFSRSDTSLRLDQWMVVVGMKQGPQKLTPAQRWQ